MYDMSRGSRISALCSIRLKWGRRTPRKRMIEAIRRQRAQIPHPRNAARAAKKKTDHIWPAVEIAKFEVAGMGFYFQDFIAADKPPVVLRIPEARLSITNLDTLMAPDLRETRLVFRTFGESPSILVEANLNPGSAPPGCGWNFQPLGIRPSKNFSLYPRQQGR